MHSFATTALHLYHPKTFALDGSLIVEIHPLEMRVPPNLPPETRKVVGCLAGEERSRGKREKRGDASFCLHEERKLSEVGSGRDGE